LRFFLFFILGAVALQGQTPTAPVRYTVARTQTFQAEVRLPGTVESRKSSAVATEIEGLVEKYPLRQGQKVEEGAVLARLRTRQLELEKQALEAELAETLVRQRLAKREYERAQELFDALVIPQEQLDAKQFEYEAWEGRDLQLKARIARVEDNIERAVVVAPFDGVVLEERTQIGEWLGKGDAVAELLSLEDLEVSVDVPERYLNRFAVGARVGLSFEALGGRRATGTVTAVIPQANLLSRAFPVKLGFKTPAGLCRACWSTPSSQAAAAAQQRSFPKTPLCCRAPNKSSSSSATRARYGRRRYARPKGWAPGSPLRAPPTRR
jgi:RND family efflux transporter MFP subunit